MRPMEKRQKRWAKQAALWVLAGSLAACSDGAGQAPTGPDPMTPTEQRRLLMEGTFVFGDPANAPDQDLQAFISFNAGAPSRLEVMVDWSNAANKIIVGVMEDYCTYLQAATSGCPGSYILLVDTPEKPKRIQTDISAGPHTLVIASYGPGAENGMYQVFLTY